MGNHEEEVCVLRVRRWEGESVQKGGAEREGK